MLPHIIRTRIEEWSVRTQLTSRRNAMVAATALAQRTAEAREVEEFLLALKHPAQEEVSATALRRHA